ncbi:MAG: hypothetical protein H0T94_00770 [Acidimicrobiia bacterium]|nr:hypothetical protein [Acidimicrobiia bacterium]
MWQTSKVIAVGVADDNEVDMIASGRLCDLIGQARVSCIAGLASRVSAVD